MIFSRVKWLFGFTALFALVLAASGRARAHESPIDHVDRVVQIYIEDGKAHLIYRFRCEERQALLQLMRMDLDADGKISDAERAAGFEKITREVSTKLRLEIDQKSLPLSPAGPIELGADYSQTFHFTAPLPALKEGVTPGRFVDEFSREHPGDYRWRARAIDTNGYAVEADAPSLAQLGPHPAMVLLPLRWIRKSPR